MVLNPHSQVADLAACISYGFLSAIQTGQIEKKKKKKKKCKTIFNAVYLLTPLGSLLKNFLFMHQE